MHIGLITHGGSRQDQVIITGWQYTSIMFHKQDIYVSTLTTEENLLLKDSNAN